MFLNYSKIRNYVQFLKHIFYERRVNINIINMETCTYSWNK